MTHQSIRTSKTGESQSFDNFHGHRHHSPLIKVVRKLHLWLSIPFGIILTLICFSGAMLVFEGDLTPHLRKSVYYVEKNHGDVLPMDKLLSKVQASLPDTVSVIGVTVFHDSERTWQVSLSDPDRASVFVNQYTGEVTGRYERIGLFKTMFNLHRWLLDSSKGHKTGRLIVGISVLLFVFILVSGVIIWAPRARHSFRKSLRIPVSHGLRPLVTGLHVAGGMYAVVFLLAMSLTGLTWSFHWYNVGFSSIFGAEVSYSSGHGHHKSRSERKSDSNDDIFKSWQTVHDRLAVKYPDADKIVITDGKADVPVKNSAHSRVADKYSFDKDTGGLRLISAFTDASPEDKVKAWVRAVHLGTWGGLLTKILWFLTALFGASLPLTGYYIWIKHLNKNKKTIEKQ